VGIDLSEHYTEIARRRWADEKLSQNPIEEALGVL